MLPRSIRWQIQAWHTGLLVTVVGILIVGFYTYERRVSLREVDAELHARVTPLLPRLAPPPGREGGPREGRMRPPHRDHEREETINELPENFYYITWGPDGEIMQQAANAPGNVPYPSRDQFGRRHPLRTRGEFREIIHHVPHGACVLLGTSMAGVHRHLRQLAWGLAAGGLALIGVGLAGGWWLASRAIQPIADISLAAQKIAEGDLSRRINVKDTETELGALAAVLNSTFDRLEKSFEQQVRFTADASHELRTPVAVILTQTQLALSRERSAEEYRQTLQTCERAAERMRNLVNQLLELARVDAGEETIVPEKCDLARIISDAIDLIQPLAQNKKSTLKHSLEPVVAKVDSMKLGQVFINLLNNAVHHNKEGTEVCVSLQREGNRAIVRVRDNGAGIPADALPNLFDRFYRVDKARARGKGNSGLGLAICKAIVEAHGGSISATSQVGEGTEFKVELPLSRDRTGHAGASQTHWPSRKV